MVLTAKMSNHISILGCMLLIGLLCCVHGETPKPFGSEPGDTIMGQTIMTPANISSFEFPVGKVPDGVSQTVHK